MHQDKIPGKAKERIERERRIKIGILDLSSLGLVNIPKEIGYFTWLEELFLSDNHITKIEGLESLSQLKTLSLWKNQITKIEGLESLSQLKKLSLFYNKITDIEGLESLSNLNTLNLSSNKITKIEGLESLSNLNTINLSSNKITKIEGLESLNQLNSLSLSQNKITKVEGLLHLQNLKDLQLLKIHENEIVSKLNFSNDYNANHLQEVLNWLSRQQEKTFPIRLPLKVVLLGNHSSGKSTLLHYLLTNEIINQDSTHGLKIAYMDDPNAVFFDFGGQDYYHGMYHHF